MDSTQYLEFELKNYCCNLIPDYENLSPDEKDYLLQRAEIYLEEDED